MATHRSCLRIFLSIALFLLVLIAKAQYYVINDGDGFVNVRKTPGTHGPVSCQLTNGMVVRESWNKDTSNKNWVFVEFYIPKSESKNIRSKPEEWMPEVMKGYLLFKGWISNDRLISVEQQEKFLKKSSGNDRVLYNDSIKITMTYGNFEREKHKIQIKGEYPVISIDGHYLVGTDGGVPHREIKKFMLEINQLKTSIPKTVYYDLYEPNFVGGYIGSEGNIYIIMSNSDGAGSYEVIFIFKDNKYFARYVFDGDC